jgi:hypothetical protein
MVGKLDPPLTAWVEVQVTVVEPTQFHPVPVKELSVKPEGRGSVTVSVLLVVLPTVVLPTAISHSPVCPPVKPLPT